MSFPGPTGASDNRGMDQSREIAVEVPRAWDRPIVTMPVLVFLSLVGGQLPSFSTRANLYTISLGGAMIWLGLSNRLPRRPHRHPGPRHGLVADPGRGLRGVRGLDVPARVHAGVPDVLQAGRSAAGGRAGPVGRLLRLAGRVLGAGAAMSLTRALAIGGFVAGDRAVLCRRGGRAPGGLPDPAPGRRLRATSCATRSGGCRSAGSGSSGSGGGWAGTSSPVEMDCCLRMAGRLPR